MIKARGSDLGHMNRNTFESRFGLAQGNLESLLCLPVPCLQHEAWQTYHLTYLITITFFAARMGRFPPKEFPFLGVRQVSVVLIVSDVLA